MKLGIVENMSATEYHAVDACSHSRLVKMLRSPAHCRWAMDNPETTPDMILGSALHAKILEPATFNDRFAVAPDVDKRTKEGKATWEKFESHLNGHTVIRFDDLVKIEGMNHAIWSHPLAPALLGGDGRNEVSAFWQDESGLYCKARADRLAELPGIGTVIVDLKTTTDASEDGFRRTIASWNYHIQAAWYLHGFAKCGVSADAFVFVAIEKEQPHGVACYSIDDEHVAIGWDRCRELSRRFAECKVVSEWPAYPTSVKIVRLPEWKLKSKEIEHDTCNA